MDGAGCGLVCGGGEKGGEFVGGRRGEDLGWRFLRCDGGGFSGGSGDGDAVGSGGGGFSGGGVDLRTLPSVDTK